MKNVLALIVAGLITIVVSLTSVTPSIASPISVQRAPIASNVEQVRYKHHHRRHWGHRYHYRHGWGRHHHRRYHWSNHHYRHGHWRHHRTHRYYYRF